MPKKQLLFLTILCQAQGVFSMENLNKQLFKAAETGNVYVARELLDKGADVNYCHPLRMGGGFYYLHRPIILQEAVENNHLEIVKLLLQRNVDVNAQYATSDWNDTTSALMSAVQRANPDSKWSNFNLEEKWTKIGNQRKIVKLLLAYGADPLQPSKHTSQALKKIVVTPLEAASHDVAMIITTAISNADAERIRKHFYAAILALKTKRGVNKDIRRILAKKIFNNLVQERMQRAMDMIHTNRKDLMDEASITEIRDMIAANIDRILSCPGDEDKEYSYDDPSAWEPGLCAIQ